MGMMVENITPEVLSTLGLLSHHSVFCMLLTKAIYPVPLLSLVLPWHLTTISHLPFIYFHLTIRLIRNNKMSQIWCNVGLKRGQHVTMHYGIHFALFSILQGFTSVIFCYFGWTLGNIILVGSHVYHKTHGQKRKKKIIMSWATSALKQKERCYVAYMYTLISIIR